MWPFDSIADTINGLVALFLYPVFSALELAYYDWCIVYTPMMDFYNSIAAMSEFAVSLISFFIAVVFGMTIAALLLISIGIAVAIRVIRLIKKGVFQWF